jgi:hypothetical protein
MTELSERLNIKYGVSIFDHYWNTAQVRLHLVFIPHSWSYIDETRNLLIWMQNE